VPFAIGFNKVLFTQPACAAGYARDLAAAYEGRMLTAVCRNVFMDHQETILVRVPRTPAHLLRSSQNGSYGCPVAKGPLAGWVKSTIVVDAIIYLESARFVTGEIVHVDGGRSAGH
jgi:hypothetical protein